MADLISICPYTFEGWGRERASIHKICEQSLGSLLKFITLLQKLPSQQLTTVGQNYIKSAFK